MSTEKLRDRLLALLEELEGSEEGDLEGYTSPSSPVTDCPYGISWEGREKLIGAVEGVLSEIWKCERCGSPASVIGEDENKRSLSLCKKCMFFLIRIDKAGLRVVK